MKTGPQSKAGPQSNAEPKLQPGSNVVKKGQKRKSTTTQSTVLSSATKRQRFHKGIRLGSSTVACLPHGMNADDLYRVFTNRTEKRYHEDLVSVVQIFFNTDRPAFVGQLAFVCRWATQLAESTGTVGGISHMVTKLDEVELADPLIRRRILVQLLDRRIELETECRFENEAQKSARKSRLTKYDLRRLTSNTSARETHGPHVKLGKPDNKALTRLMAECYPRLPSPQRGKPQSSDAIYVDFKDRLQRRLQAACNWRSLKERFGLGILLFVPCDIQANR